MVFWYDVPSLAECSCVIARKQVAPLTELLALLPSSGRCQFVQAGSTHLIQDEHTTIFLPTVSDPHPFELSAVLARRPHASFRVNASVFNRELNGLGTGEADNGDFVFVHGTLMVGSPTVLQTESLNPRTGGQFTRGADINAILDQAPEAAGFLADHRAMKRAAARLDDDVTVRMGTKSLYIDGVMKGRYPVKRTARLGPLRPSLPRSFRAKCAAWPVS